MGRTCHWNSYLQHTVSAYDNFILPTELLINLLFNYIEEEPGQLVQNYLKTNSLNNCELFANSILRPFSPPRSTFAVIKQIKEESFMNYFLRIVLAYITVVILLQVISYLFNSNKSIVESLLTAVIPILAVIIVNYFYKKRTK